MSSTPRPHDLLWLNHASALEAIAEPWVAQQWRAALPVVVRRDVDDQARIPVGVRGMKREQRAAGWVQAHNIVRSVTPEMLVERERLLGSPFVSQPPVQAAIALTLHPGPGAGASPAVPAMRWPLRSRYSMRQAIWIC